MLLEALRETTDSQSDFFTVSMIEVIINTIVVRPLEQHELESIAREMVLEGLLLEQAGGKFHLPARVTYLPAATSQ